MKELADALKGGNVRAMVGIIYLTDGDTLRFRDSGTLPHALLRGDILEMLGDME